MLNAPFETLRVAVLTSHRAPGLETLLQHPQRSRLYEIVCVMPTEDDFVEQQLVRDANIPLIPRSVKRFHQARNAKVRDMNVRREFDRVNAEALGRIGANCILLLGYLYIVTDPMLSAFPGAILNVHDADLTIRRPDGRRKYIGLHATRDALAAGEPEVRSSVHIVDDELDAGPLLVTSKPYAVAPFIRDAIAAGAFDVVKAYAYAQREWMMRDCWGSLAVRALEYLASGISVEEACATAV